MKKDLRLRRNADFVRAYRKGRRAYNYEFRIFGRRNGKEANRYGFSLSKKLGKAVTRNRLKRQLREIVRLHEEEFPKAYDYIIIPNPLAVGKSYSELEASLFHCLNLWIQKKEKKAKKTIPEEPGKEKKKEADCALQEKNHE